ncbi:MAG: ferredoxin family protein [Candidatus Omnitrophota bacterium]
MEKTKSQKKSGAKITINEKWCKRCGICTAFCPQGVFVEDEFKLPIVKYPEKCIKCMLCVVRCPEFAVEVEAIEEEEKGRAKKETKKKKNKG